MADVGGAEKPSAKTSDKKARSTKAEIPPGLSYVLATGVLKKILAKIIEAPAPEKLTQDYLANVWNFSGGSAMAVLPLLKKLDFLSSDGTPTDHFKNFRTTSHRNSAIRHALRKGFPDIYRQTDFAESAKEQKVIDTVLSITGRTKQDPTVKAILATFKAFVELMTSEEGPVDASPEPRPSFDQPRDTGSVETKSPYTLSYQINIVLPETKDVEVFDAIFRKLKEHLL